MSRAGFPGVSCVCPKGHLYLQLQSHPTNQQWPWGSILSERKDQQACVSLSSCHVTVSSHASPVSRGLRPQFTDGEAEPEKPVTEVPWMGMGGEEPGTQPGP